MKKFYSIIVIVFLFSACNARNLQEDGMVLYEIEHFNIYHEGESEKTLEDISTVLHEAYDVVVSFFKIEPEKTDVYFYKDQKVFQSKKHPIVTKFLNLKWYVGDNIGADALAVSPETLINYRSYEESLNIIAHEYIHTIIYRMNEHCNLWINEGIALFLTNGNRSKNILRYYKIPQMKLFNNNNSLTFERNSGYQFADKFIEFTAAKYGYEKVYELISSNNYEEVFGKTLKEIYAEWVEYLQQNYNE